MSVNKANAINKRREMIKYRFIVEQVPYKTID